MDLEIEKLENALKRFNMQNTAMQNVKYDTWRKFDDNGVRFNLNSNDDFPPLS